MLPPGHIAAGFLTAEALLKITHPNLTPNQLNQLLFWGAFWGFAPDLDYFYSFALEKAFTIKDTEKNNHRRFITHAPVVWLTAGLLIFFLATSPFWKTFGLLVWLGSWSHFLLDSIEYGVIWLWPLSKKKYAFKHVESFNITKRGFFAYWWEFVKLYTKAITFYAEIIILVSAFIIYLTNH